MKKSSFMGVVIGLVYILLLIYDLSQGDPTDSLVQDLCHGHWHVEGEIPFEPMGICMEGEIQDSHFTGVMTCGDRGSGDLMMNTVAGVPIELTLGEQGIHIIQPEGLRQIYPLESLFEAMDWGSNETPVFQKPEDIHDFLDRVGELKGIRLGYLDSGLTLNPYIIKKKYYELNKKTTLAISKKLSNTRLRSIEISLETDNENAGRLEWVKIQ